MKEDYIYLVYRAYSEEERPHSTDKDRLVLYGWTTRKKILKAFFDQRNRKKYKVRKIIPQEAYLVLGNDPDPLYLIDFIDLKSAKTGEDVVLFMTREELKEVEIKIQRYFSDLSRLMINMRKSGIRVSALDGWTVYTKDKLPSAQWEHTFLATEEGFEILTY